MNYKSIICVLMIFCFHLTASGFTGKEIIEKAKANIQQVNVKSLPETVKVRMTMAIVDGNERIEREFDIMSKRYGEKEGKVLISFIRPSRMKILAHADKNGQQDIWMKMSSGKIRKISMEENRPIPILSDSHFAFDDINVSGLGNLGFDLKNLNFNVKELDNQLDKFDFKYLGEKKVGDTECYQVESKMKDQDFKYNKVNYYFRKTDFYPLRIDFFKNDTLYKYLELYDLKKVDAYTIPFRLQMTLANGKDHTTLKIIALKLNGKIKDSRFSRGAL